MPRQIHTVELFSRGVITSVSPEDLPDNAATQSVDIDRTSSPGALQGRVEDEFYGTETNHPLLNAELIRNPDDTYDLIGIDSTDMVTTIEDVYDATPTVTNDVQSLPNTLLVPPMIKFNRSVRIGRGATKSYDPYFVGRVDHIQFGETITGIQCERAQLVSPSVIETMEKLVYADGEDWVYGYVRDDGFVYRMYPESLVVESEISGFSTIEAMCYHDGHIYIYDKGLGTADIGAVVKIDASTKMTIGQCNLVSLVGDSNQPNNATVTITDMLVTDDYCYLAWSNNSFTADSNTYTLLERFDCNPFPETAVPASFLAPKMFGTADPGNTDYGARWTGVGAVVIQAAKFSLAKSNTAGEIIWSGKFEAGSYITYNNGGTPAYATVNSIDGSGPFVLFIDEDYVTESGGWTLGGKVTGLKGAVACHASNAYAEVNGFSLLGDGTDPFAFFYDHANNYVGCIEDIGVSSEIDWTASGMYRLASNDTTGAYVESVGTGNLAPIVIAVDLVTAEEVTIVGIAYSTAVDTIHTVTYDYGTDSFTVLNRRPPVTIEATGVDAGEGTFADTMKAFYRCSFIYDGYQESPLSNVLVTVTDFSTEDCIDLTLILVPESNGVRAISARVTGVNIYRAEHTTSSTSSVPNTLYRLVTTMEIPSVQTLNEDGDFTYSYRDRRDYGPSYEDNTGIPENIEVTHVAYELSTISEGYVFVGNIWHPLLGSQPTMVLRSKRNAPDMFDWSNDFLNLPEIPVAMVGWRGKLLVWSKTNMYVIDTESMALNDVIQGYGCDNPRACYAGDSGVYFADQTNIYLYNGQNILPIGNSIRTGVDLGGSFTDITIPYLEALEDGMRPMIVPYIELGYILVFMTNTTTTDVPVEPLPIYAYHLANQDFDFWDGSWMTGPTHNDGPYLLDCYGAVVGKNLEVLLLAEKFSTGPVYEGDLMKICGGTDRKQLTWYSKIFMFNRPQQDKDFVTARVAYSGSAPTLTWQVDGGSWVTPALDYGKQLFIKIEGDDDGTSVINSLEIVYRNLMGAR